MMGGRTNPGANSRVLGRVVDVLGRGYTFDGANGEFRDVLFYRADVEANLEREYNPGQ